MSLASGADEGAVELILRRLFQSAAPEPEDAELIRGLCADNTREHPAWAALGLYDGSAFLLSGWACRARLLPDGRRQILGFFVPGDLIPPGGGEGALHPTFAVTRAQTADAAVLDAAPPASLADRRALWQAAARERGAEAARHMEHIVRLGALSAYQSVLHLMVELHDRHAAVGLAEDGRFPFPLAQETMAEALGFSEVHTNRVLAQLRRDGLLDLGPGWARLPDMDAVAAILP